MENLTLKGRYVWLGDVLIGYVSGYRDSKTGRGDFHVTIYRNSEKEVLCYINLNHSYFSDIRQMFKSGMSLLDLVSCVYKNGENVLFNAIERLKAYNTIEKFDCDIISDVNDDEANIKSFRLYHDADTANNMIEIEQISYHSWGAKNEYYLKNVDKHEIPIVLAHLISVARGL